MNNLQHGLGYLTTFGTRLLPTVSTISSLIRIAGWTILFFTLFAICLSRPAPEKKMNSSDLRQAREHHYQPIDKAKTNPASLRIAITGSSESLNYNTFRDSIGMSMLRQIPAGHVPEIEIIEGTFAGKSRRWKFEKLIESLEYNVDVIIVSQSLDSYFVPTKKNEFSESPPNSVLTILIGDPCAALDKAVAVFKPNYKGSFGAFFRGDDEAQKMFSPTISVDSQDTGAKDIDLEDMPLSPVPMDSPADVCQKIPEKKASIETHRCNDCSSINIDTCRETLETMADPAVRRNIPVVFLVAPKRKICRFDEHILYRTYLVDQVADKITNPNIHIFNVCSKYVVEDSVFNDGCHLNNFDSLAKALLDYLGENGLLQSHTQEPEERASAAENRKN